MKAYTKYKKLNIKQLYRYPIGPPLKVHVGDLKTNLYLPEGWLCQDKKRGFIGIFLFTPDNTR